ncbi:MAG: hypothetical protein NZ581_08280, partial [Candidatus Caldarchaeum sp.]|nr:hypothetical protein [Candidatus Caldarchaeum sp.]MDW8436170.1 hypothetical protein [Candidatus Caldarchaeum sp.]
KSKPKTCSYSANPYPSLNPKTHEGSETPHLNNKRKPFWVKTGEMNHNIRKNNTRTSKKVFSRR